MDWSPEVWTAIATVAIAVFTIVLAVSGGIQAWLTRDAINLARDEFLASHRPELVIRDIHWAEGDKDNPGRIVYTLINRGSSPATVVESLLRYRSNLEGTEVLEPAGANDIGPITLASGEYRHLFAPMISEGEEMAAAAHTLGMLEDHSFRGVIIYADQKGTRRRMVFRRICMRSTNLRGTGDRFVKPADNEEYEYTD